MIVANEDSATETEGATVAKQEQFPSVLDTDVTTVPEDCLETVVFDEKAVPEEPTPLMCERLVVDARGVCGEDTPDVLVSPPDTDSLLVYDAVGR